MEMINVLKIKQILRLNVLINFVVIKKSILKKECIQIYSNVCLPLGSMFIIVLF